MKRKFLTYETWAKHQEEARAEHLKFLAQIESGADLGWTGPCNPTPPPEPTDVLYLEYVFECGENVGWEKGRNSAEKTFAETKEREKARQALIDAGLDPDKFLRCDEDYW